MSVVALVAVTIPGKPIPLVGVVVTGQQVYVQAEAQEVQVVIPHLVAPLVAVLVQLMLMATPVKTELLFVVILAESKTLGMNARHTLGSVEAKQLV